MTLNESDTSELIMWLYFKSCNAHFSVQCLDNEKTIGCFGWVTLNRYSLIYQFFLCITGRELVHLCNEVIYTFRGNRSTFWHFHLVWLHKLSNIYIRITGISAGGQCSNSWVWDNAWAEGKCIICLRPTKKLLSSYIPVNVPHYGIYCTTKVMLIADFIP